MGDRSLILAALGMASSGSGGGGEGGTTDHRQLTHKDANEQHPISAITGLTAALAEKGTYSKPTDGIPYADLADAIKDSLDKADSALQTAPVTSVNGKTGAINLVPSDLGIGSVFALKGSKPSYADLPVTGNTIGDVWYVVADSVGYIWLNDGTTDRWEQLGMEIDVSAFYTKTESDEKYAEKDDLDGKVDTTGGEIDGDLLVAGNLRASALWNTEQDIQIYLGADEGDVGVFDDEDNPVPFKVGTATDNTDAANKGYVDNAIAAAIGDAIGGAY